MTVTAIVVAVLLGAIYELVTLARIRRAYRRGQADTNALTTAVLADVAQHPIGDSLLVEFEHTAHGEYTARWLHPKAGLTPQPVTPPPPH